MKAKYVPAFRLRQGFGGLVTGMTLLLILLNPAHAAPRPVVVELYTSQGCSSCPEADALLEKMVSDPAILPLSFHVHYWDSRGWKDPFSSEFNTARQRAYQQTLGLESVYTPQVIVDGQISAIGSDKYEVDKALAAVRKNTVTIPITLTPDADNLIIDIAGGTAAYTMPSTAVAWEVHFNHGSTTAVKGGENNGKVIENVNNVTRFMRLSLNVGQENKYALPMNEWPEDAVAIILQDKPVGRIIGAAVYVRQGKG